MGSPSSRLKTAEQFRPWVESGLQYIYHPGGVPQQAQPVQQQAVQTPAQQSAPQQVPQQAPQPPVQSQAPQHQVQPAAQSPVQQPVQQAQQQAAPASTVKFPEPWAGFLAKVKATAPKVVCTYMELGLDLGGQPDAKRGAVLRNTLTNHLKWPPGTAAFWPMAALVDNALQPNHDMFWRGWELWKSPYIACFGDEALKVILPQEEPGRTTYLLEHVTIFVLPPISQLVTMLPHEQQMATDLLLGVRL